MKSFVKKSISFLIFLLVAYCLIKFLDGYYSKRIRDYIKQEATNSSTRVIENIVRNVIVDEIDADNIISVNSKGIIVDTKKVNNILAKTNENLLASKDVFSNLENLELPLGIIFSDALFNIGPNIKIKMLPIGSGKTDVVTSIDEYGINNSLFRMDLAVSMSFQTLIPLNNQEIQIETKIPIVAYIIQGEVPRYYSYGASDKIIPFADYDEWFIIYFFDFCSIIILYKKRTNKKGIKKWHKQKSKRK